jgi:hypothetical protein
LSNRLTRRSRLAAFGAVRDVRVGIRGAMRRRAEAAGWHLAPASGFDLVPRSYYSPIVDPADIPAAVWDRRAPMAGVEIDTEAQIAWAEERLGAHIRDFRAERSGAPGEFFYDNRNYEYGDAELAWAMVRGLRPERIVELGSGFSTLVLARACVANGREGRPAQLEVNDPFPSDATNPERMEGVTTFRRRPAQDVDPGELAELRAGDVLFVDTTHTVRVGGDVNHVVLDLLPVLAPGVVVHFHDIWLPYEYHRALFEVLGMQWAEQYLLHAFLIGNRGWEVLFATHAVAVEQAERLEALVPSYTGANFPSGFWMRRG